MLNLTAHDLIERLSYDVLTRQLPKLLQVETESPQRHVHTLRNQGEPDATLLLMPAWAEGMGGVKLVNVTPGNLKRGLPAVTASYLLFDAITGEHLALLDGGELTARRTAAVAAIAADRLASAQAHDLLLVGSGRIASELAFAYRAVRDIRSVEVHSQTQANAEKLAHHLRDNGFNAHASHDLQASAAKADIIACATLSNAPLIKGEWVRAGQHVALIGGYLKDMREGDDLLMTEGQVWVDSYAAMSEAGDLTQPIAAGLLHHEAIRGTLADLCRVAAIDGRSEAVTVFKSVGDAAQDLAAASLAVG
ncbi:ornithine cyclodeaminase family protein [Asticcacaulis sp. 201]|uniref:ornithine cyclodeaminase family protein n=1 Tax=Asticcacaulis sp. 201 TaxID=3028787 RepID=UPI002916C59A|nr:ornithine cyclodeaminase family protein [Asticcacaulis sp. 201]MDV6330461.1 ornithine cyclodeaminase family protein [Asticcacaulis sp. 201]